MNGSLYVWSNLNVYFASYLHHNGNEDLTPEDTSFLMPCIFLIQYCVMTLGVKLGDKIGPRYVTLIGLLLMYLSYIIMILTTNYYLVLLAMGIFGLGDGIANLSLIKNCWKYYPNNTALVNGIIIGGLGISSAILTPIADYVIINPEKKEPIGDFYEKEIANNLLNYLYFIFILFIFLGFIATFLTIKYEDEEDKDISKNENLTVKKDNRSLKLMWEGFFSEKNYFLLLFCFCGPRNYNILFNIKFF